MNFRLIEPSYPPCVEKLREAEEGEGIKSKVNFVSEKEYLYKDDKNEIQEMGSESE